MMMEEQDLWDQLSSAHRAFTLALQRFLSKDFDRVGLLKKELLGRDRSTAIYLLRFTPPDELINLLDEFVFLASFSHGSIEAIRLIILSLPRDQVLKRIEQISGPILDSGTYDEYRRLLELYMRLDSSLAKKLALRALEHIDEDIKEVGKDFLDYLNNKS